MFVLPHSQNQSKVVPHMLMQALSNKKWGSVDVKRIPPGGTKLKQHDSKQLCRQKENISDANMEDTYLK